MGTKQTNKMLTTTEDAFLTSRSSSEHPYHFMVKW